MKVFIAVFIFTISFGIWGQGISSVAVVSDSTSTIIHDIQDIMQAIQTVSNTLETVKGLSNMIQNQIKSVESLSSGTFDGLVQAWDYQVESLGNFSSVLEQADALPYMSKITESESYMSTKDSVKNLQKALKQDSNLLHATQATVRNAKQRADSFKNIQSASQNTQSTVAQLQLTTEAIGLVQGQLADVNSNLVALNMSVQTQADVAAAQNAINQRQGKEFATRNDDVTKSKISDADAHEAYQAPKDSNSNEWF